MRSYLVKICIIWTFWTKGVVEIFFLKNKKKYQKRFRENDVYYIGRYVIPGNEVLNY